DERERFSLDEMIENFDIQRVSLGGPVFDVEKLSWLNGLYIRETLDDQQFMQEVMKWAFNPEYVSQIIPQIKGRVETFSDIAPLAGFFFSGMLPITEESFAHIKAEKADVVKQLQFTLWQMEALREWNKDNIFADVKMLADHFEVKIKEFLQPIFVAIAGSATSSSVLDSMAIIGPDMTRARLRHAVEVLGGVSKKQTKKLEKEFAALNQ
ncbi:MAG: glutamate--tRNA ligase, partial [Oceanospirillum sp.]|nr:glutamate--tRNA ligase [Oceanospirillum sp.]